MYMYHVPPVARLRLRFHLDSQISDMMGYFVHHTVGMHFFWFQPFIHKKNCRPQLARSGRLRQVLVHKVQIQKVIPIIGASILHQCYGCTIGPCVLCILNQAFPITRRRQFFPGNLFLCNQFLPFQFNPKSHPQHK